MSTEQERQRLREVAEAAINDLFDELMRENFRRYDGATSFFVVRPERLRELRAEHRRRILDELAAVEREWDEAVAGRVHWRDEVNRMDALVESLTASRDMHERSAQRLARDEAKALARAEAAEGVVARVRELVDQADAGEGIVIYPGHGEYHCVETGLLRAVLSDPTPGMDPTSGDGANGAPGRQSASPGGTSGANDAGGIQEGE